MMTQRLALLCGMACLASLPREAEACTCRPLTDAKARTTADIGFRGRVLSVEPVEKHSGLDCEPIAETRRQGGAEAGCITGDVRFRHKRGCARHIAPTIHIRQGQTEKAVTIDADGGFKACGLDGPVDVSISTGVEMMFGYSNGTYLQTHVGAGESVEIHPAVPKRDTAHVVKLAVSESMKGVDPKFGLEVRTSFCYCCFGKRFEVGREYDVWAWKREDGKYWTHSCAARDVSSGPAPAKGCAGCATGESRAPSLVVIILLGALGVRRRRQQGKSGPRWSEH